MKYIKIISVILVIAITICIFEGCTYSETEDITTEKQESRFVVVEETYFNISVVYDRETLVMYAVSRCMYNSGNVTMLVNADGTPLLYETGVEE